MRRNILLIAASVATLATAQDLATVLAGQPSLSTLVELLGANPATTDFLSSQEGATLFAPNNKALASILQNGGIFNIEDAATDAGLVEQTLRYHLYRGVIRSTDFTQVPQFVPGYLNYSSVVLDGDVSGSNVTGGQVVSVQLDEEGSPVVISGIKSPSNVLVPDLEYDNGVVHIIDELLTIPLELTITLLAGGFTALAGAATQVDLVQPITELSDITIFCPNNDAFRDIASGSASITDEQLTEILSYHVVQGTVGYSTVLSNTSLPTLNGQNVEITVKDNGAVFVNSARVINADVLIANGVLHVIDEVLDPSNPDFQPGEDVDEPIASATSVPFTSGLEPLTGFSELIQTTSFVAAGLVTDVPSVTSIPANVSVTSSYAPVVQTGNAGAKNELPALAVAVGALAFAINV